MGVKDVNTIQSVEGGEKIVFRIVEGNFLPGCRPCSISSLQNVFFNFSAINNLSDDISL
ncbi:MAG: hypothetical protein ACOCV3_02805 [Halanaerobiales bacterium]